MGPGDVLGQLESGVVVGCHDPDGQPRLLRGSRGSVGRTLGQPGGRGQQIGDRLWIPSRHHAEEASTVLGVPVSGVTESIHAASWISLIGASTVGCSGIDCSGIGQF